MTDYAKNITSLTQAFMSKVTNTDGNEGRFKADVFNARVNEYLWPHERAALQDIGRDGMRALNAGASRDDIAPAASVRHAEIYAAVACRNASMLLLQASRFVDLAQTDDNTVAELKAAKLKNFAKVVARARRDKNLAI